MQHRPANLAFANLQQVNSGPTRCLPLFFVPPRRPHPRISAAKAMPIADNFLQEQRKQRGNPPLRGSPPGDAEMAAEASDFDRPVRRLKSRQGQRPSPPMIWPHLRGLQPEEEALLQICCRSSGLSCIGQPQAAGWSAPLAVFAGGEGRGVFSRAVLPVRNGARPNR
jgi:hypothetical protein